MEDRVKSMLKLIEGDADSFGKRAELYFKSRPELISFVEEAYRAYRALAERYDHISGELHKANHTIATAFPDQVQYAMLEEEEEDNFPKAITPIDARKPHKPMVESLISKRKEDRSAINKTQCRSITFQIGKDKAQEEINRLQKAILILQTEKEFIKSSYESGIAEYWEIEKQITEMHEEVCCLQDEFNTSAVIEDNEARALMTATALKSCEEAIANLHEQRKKSMEQARIESGRIRIAEEKLKVLKEEDAQCNLETRETADGNKEINSSIVNMEDTVYSLKQERLELQKICEKVQEHFEVNYDTSVEEIVEKIDEIVKKIVNLELKVSSHTAQINRLSSENNELEKYLQGLEEEKLVLINDSNELSDRLKQAEEELLKVQFLEKTVQDEETTLCANFSDACHSLDVISEKLLSPEHQEQVSVTNPFIEEHITLYIKPQRECKEQEVAQSQDTEEISVKEETHGIQELGHNIEDHDQPKAGSEPENNVKRIHDSKKKDKKDSSHVDASIQVEVQTLPGEQESTIDLQQLLLNGLEDREKLLLAEYTSVLRNYKEAKKRLSEVEKKNQEYARETMAIIWELTSANSMKDEEIQSLRQHLGSSKMSSNGYADANSAEDEEFRHSHRRLKSVLQLPTLTKENSNLPNSENPKVNVQSFAKVDTLTMAVDRGSPHVEDIKLQHIDEPQSTSSIEEKFRRDIDELLDENLDFWLKFSTSFHRIQEFQTTLKDLQSEMEKLRDSKLQEGINSALTDQVVRAESAPIDRKLKALKTELQVWLEQNALLRGELQCRLSSLCDIQEEISEVLKDSSECEVAQFTPYQAAKFQGEVLNMQQENNKVANELQAGLDHVRGLQAEIEKALLKLHEDFELSGSKSSQHPHFRNLSTKTRIPLRSFLFGTKPKRTSIFSCMNPAFHKQYSDLRPGFPR